MNLGEYIQKKRKEKNLSLKALADLTGLTDVSIFRIEKGQVEPRKTSLRAIAVCLDLKYQTLLEMLKIEQEIKKESNAHVE